MLKNYLLLFLISVLLGSCAMDNTGTSVSKPNVPVKAPVSGSPQGVTQNPAPEEPAVDDTPDSDAEPDKWDETETDEIQEEEPPPIYHLPELIINELGTESVIVSGTTRAEFIEFRIKTDGNLGGLRVFILANSAAPIQTIYDFPAVEVKKDDYVVLHLRTSSPESKDELGDNLAESGGLNSSAAARDLWLSGTDKRLHKTAIVYVADSKGNILDAAIISDNPAASWQASQFIETAALLTGQDTHCFSCAWSGLPFNSASATSTRTINRYAANTTGNNAAAWYIAPTGGATPGAPNK